MEEREKKRVIYVSGSDSNLGLLLRLAVLGLALLRGLSRLPSSFLAGEIGCGDSEGLLGPDSLSVIFNEGEAMFIYRVKEK